MGGKGRIQGIILTALALAGCSAATVPDETEVRISFSGGGLQSRALDPDEYMISDISLMIFDGTGAAEECFWLDGGQTECTARLMTDKKYIFCACANFGYQVYADNMAELDEIAYHLAYPDEYRPGIPMYAYQEVIIREGSGEITVNLERLMAKISLRMDRRELSDGVEMFVRAVRIGNCPRRVTVFKDSRAASEDECFPAGFSRSGAETDPLNTVTESGMSGYISLYMLENMQGSIQADGDSDKVFGDDDYRRNVCSFIEMELEYMSGNYYSGGKGLIYRFYLGEDRNSLDVERNCHYRITVTPEDDGLSENSWRIDKGDLMYSGPTSFKAYPSDYIVGDIGDRIHIWCDVFPEDTPFDVGISYMEDDRANGIYEYELDENGHGAVLTLTGPGTGLIYMEAGPPVNEAALFFIEVNLPASGPEQESY